MSRLEPAKGLEGVAKSPVDAMLGRESRIDWQSQAFNGFGMVRSFFDGITGQTGLKQRKHPVNLKRRLFRRIWLFLPTNGAKERDG
jgi:hypothetical protein